MPAVSFYLKQDVLDAVRARAKAEDVAVSRVISRAVEAFLEAERRGRARKRVLRALVKHPLA